MNNPKLRFKADDGSEFSAWEETEIGKIGTFTKGAALSKADISDTGTPFVLYGELYTTYKEVAFTIRRKTEAVVDEKYYSKMGDVVIPTSGESPEEISTATCIMVPNVILAGDLNIFRSDTIDGRIMSYILNYQAKNKIATIAQGKSIVHIQAKELSKVKIKYPIDVNEQRKIAEFLSMIDEIIQSTESELTAWQERKKGVMQKIFNREVRFKADDGSEFPEWEEKTFSEILSENKIPIPKPTNGYERLGIRSHGKGTFHEYVPAGEGLDVDTMYVVEAHNLILNITFAWEQAIAITDNEDDGKLVSHRFPQYKFNDGFDWHYFKYDILDKKLKHELGLASPGGAGRNRVLNKSDFLRIKRVVPCLDEQKKIADCLSSLDDVISNIQAELSAWKEFKKGLLQQMFV